MTATQPKTKGKPGESPNGSLQRHTQTKRGQNPGKRDYRGTTKPAVSARSQRSKHPKHNLAVPKAAMQQSCKLRMQQSYKFRMQQSYKLSALTSSKLPKRRPERANLLPNFHSSRQGQLNPHSGEKRHPRKRRKRPRRPICRF